MTRTSGVALSGCRHDLTFGAWIYHPQIKTLTEVARECPDVKIVLNHFGGPLGVGPYKRDEVFPGWCADIKVLSTCPNEYVKLGGLAMLFNAFKRLASGASASEKADLFAGTASRFYRLGN